MIEACDAMVAEVPRHPPSQVLNLVDNLPRYAG